MPKKSLREIALAVLAAGILAAIATFIIFLLLALGLPSLARAQSATPPAFHVGAACNTFAAAEELAIALVESYPAKSEPAECQPVYCNGGPCLYSNMAPATIVFGPMKDAEGDAFAVYEHLYSYSVGWASEARWLWLVTWLPGWYRPSEWGL